MFVELECTTFNRLREQGRLPMNVALQPNCPHALECNGRYCHFAPTRPLNLREDQAQEDKIEASGISLN